jgi:hypothetical protein
MCGRMTLVRTDVSEERIASIISFKSVSELGTTLAVFGPKSDSAGKVQHQLYQ